MPKENEISQEDLTQLLEQIAKSMEAISIYFSERSKRLNPKSDNMQIMGNSQADEDRDREAKWQKCMDEATKLNREGKVTAAGEKVNECNKLLRPW